MQSVVYDDVTSLVSDLVKDLKPGEMVHSNLFNLYESMSAIEIYDPKMDLKSNLKDCVTLESALKKEIIKKPENLTVQELTGLFDELLGKEFIWLSGQSLPHTIYTFSYLYNSDLYETHKFLKPYIDAVHFGGSICQDLIRHSMYLREEDYIPSSIGFLPTKGEDELVQALINAEYELEDNLSQKKKKKKKNDESKVTYNEFDALHARLKLRRGLINLYSSLKGKYSLKAKEQVANHLNFCRKTLEIIKETMEHSADVEKYFIESINKSLLCHIPPRKIKTITKKDAITDLEKFLDNIQFVLNIGTYTNFFEIYRTLENLSSTPRNILARAYLDVNIFVNGQYFGLTPMKQLALDALEEFTIVKGRELVTIPEVVKFVENSVNLLEEIFTSNLRCKTKQRRELVKLYQHINIFAHDAYTLDQNVLGKGEDKPHVLFLWVLDIALKLMIKQLFMGFELELYNEAEHCITFYLLEHVFSFLDRNCRGVISKYDKEFLMAYQSKELNDKKKKKITPFQKKFFYEHIFYRALEAYSRCMMKITYMVIFKDIIPFNKDVNFLKNRYYKRLKIFDFIYFLKKPEFNEFTEDMKKLEEKDLDAHYTEVKAEFDNAIKWLHEVTAEEGIDEKIKQDAEKLKKICVLNSLQMMKLKMSKDKLGEFKAVYKFDEHKLYPVLDLQKK